MAVSREDKKNRVADHLGAIRSYAHAVELIAKSFDDTKTMCALDLIAEQIVAEAEGVECLFDELAGDGKC